MDENDAPVDTETDETNLTEVDTPETDTDSAQANTDTFSREYVEGLRKESAGYRDRAKTAETRVDELSRALFLAKVAATGKLSDPTDLEYNADLLDDPEALDIAIDVLTESKPHLKARKITGDVGQGSRGKGEQPFSLLQALKGL
ncbi:hypothetical protein ACTWP6_27330 [Mycobacterium sp. 4D054]|uniref:hypothetical protein n=1 Tax=Mycobacterium sp. 4D054 TaxID=3457440 RepID=UPI003FD2D1D6